MLKRIAGMMIATAALMLAQQSKIARPGAINYIEGQVSLNGQTIDRQQIGTAEAEPGQVLETGNGKAEMLLTPGVFVRLSDHSAVRMVSASLTDTRVELLQGEAMVEADEVLKENRITVLDHGATTFIEKNGIYEFRAEQPMVAVFDGKLDVRQDDHSTEVGKGKELILGQSKTQKFDRDTAEATDPLYSWSRVRSEYVAEANMSTAQTFVVGGLGWYGTGWYWNPYYASWAFMPGDGFLYSPFGFGWGFYSPAYWRVYAPYGGYYRGFAGRGVVGRAYAAPGARFNAAPAMRMGGFGGGARFGGGGAHFGGGGGRR